jgi:hypothetical protein
MLKMPTIISRGMLEAYLAKLRMKLITCMPLANNIPNAMVREGNELSRLWHQRLKHLDRSTI